MFAYLLSTVRLNLDILYKKKTKHKCQTHTSLNTTVVLSSVLRVKGHKDSLCFLRILILALRKNKSAACQNLK